MLADFDRGWESLGGNMEPGVWVWVQRDGRSVWEAGWVWSSKGKGLSAACLWLLWHLGHRCALGPPLRLKHSCGWRVCVQTLGPLPHRCDAGQTSKWSSPSLSSQWDFSALTTSTTAAEHRAGRNLRKSLSTEKSKPMFPLRGVCLHSLYHFRTQCVWLNTGRSHQRNLETWASVLSPPVTGLPGGSTVKNLPAIQEMQEMCISWSLGWEDLLEGAWQPTPVFLPGESRGQRSLVGYSPWGHRESDMTAATEHPHASSYWPWALGKIAWFSCLCFLGVTILACYGFLGDDCFWKVYRMLPCIKEELPTHLWLRCIWL